MADSSGRSTAKPEDRERGTPDALDASLDPAPTFTPIDTSRGRFKRNVLANLIYFVFNAGIQLWFVRYLIDNLGVATYGLVPLATNITNYMAIITVALSGSVGRFLTIDLARGDIATANRTFNTSLFASIVLAIALLPVAGALSWFAPAFLDIPAGEEMGTRFLLVCTCFAFLLNAVGSNFACSTFAKNRFDVQRGIDALGFITQIGVVVALFTWAEGDLWYVGAGIAASAVVRQLGYQVSWRALTPELSIRFASFDRTRLREILGMGGWLTVNSAGWILLLNLDLLLTNLLVGAAAAGVYAPFLQLSNLVRTAVTTASSALTPSIVASEALGDTDRLARTTVRAVRLLGLVVVLPSALVCGLSRPLMHLWLGPSHAEYSGLAWLIVGASTLVNTVQPYSAVLISGNRLRQPGVITLANGLLQLLLCTTAARFLGWGVYGIAAGAAVSQLLNFVVYRTPYVSRALGVPTWSLARPLVLVLLYWAALSAAALAASYLAAASWLMLVTVAVVLGLSYALVAMRSLPSEDRQLLLGSLRPSR